MASLSAHENDYRVLQQGVCRITRKEALGVIEFFSAQARLPDNELLAMFATVSSQIGQFIARKQLEDQLRSLQAALGP